MTDGPFDNLNLGKNWEKFNKAIQNESAGASECAAIAADTMLKELSVNNARLIKNLVTRPRQGQIEFDQASFSELTFSKHPSTLFSDKLQKELKPQLHNGATFEKALIKAGIESVSSHISESYNRVQEGIIQLRDNGKINADQCQKLLKKTNATFRAVDKQGICNALLGGNKNAFKKAASKKTKLDDGPTLP